ETAQTITLCGSVTESDDFTFCIVIARPRVTFKVVPYTTLLRSSPNTDSATVVYTPNANYNGPDSFTYKVTDGGDGTAAALDSDPATVPMTVSQANAKPTADAKSDTTPEDTPKTIMLSGSDVETV